MIGALDARWPVRVPGGRFANRPYDVGFVAGVPANRTRRATLIVALRSVKPVDIVT